MIVSSELKKGIGKKVHILCYSTYLQLSSNQSGVARRIYRKHYENMLRKEDIYLPTFDLAIIVKATDNFSSSNKLGEGGFGPVYKVLQNLPRISIFFKEFLTIEEDYCQGTLGDGQELAVKRLSKNSGQGLEEFKNEVVLIAKLQHRNLVKLRGCCIEAEEIMLIYEYMANKSLDNIIFGLNLDNLH